MAMRSCDAASAIDGLGWPAGISFASHGARLGVRVDAPAVLDRVAEHLPPGWRPALAGALDALYSVSVAPAGSDRSHRLFLDGESLAHSDRLDHLLARLESQLHFHVATHARRHLFVHAGALTWRGRGLLIPGRSMAGKSELTAALVEAGATYYSDEYAVLDDRGWLHPYAKPLALRRDGTAKLRVECPPGRTGGGPVPVGAVVLARYVAGASWRPRPVTPGQAMAALLDNTVLARARPGAAMPTLARAASGAVALEGDRGEADRMAGELLARIRSG